MESDQRETRTGGENNSDNNGENRRVKTGGENSGGEYSANIFSANDCHPACLVVYL